MRQKSPAGLAALDCSDWPQRALALFRTEKPFLTEGLTALGFTVLPGDANYLFFSGPSGVYEKLRERGVLIRDCSNYRGLCSGDYRLAIRTHEENEKLLRAIEEALHV